MPAVPQDAAAAVAAEATAAANRNESAVRSKGGDQLLALVAFPQEISPSERFVIDLKRRVAIDSWNAIH